MKKNYPIAGWLMLLALSAFNLQPSTAQAQGTAFTYQGQLQNNGSPASGTYNLTFSLFDTDTSGVAVAGPVTNNGVIVSNGLFTVLVDFGPGAFTGATNWLEVAVATNRASTFTTLTPRQQLTPTPYAIYAESASGLSGTLSASQLTSIGNTNGGSGNFFVGPAGNSTMSGEFNTANGDYALSVNTNGNNNTANGYAALSANTSGNNNTANGGSALARNTTGSYNTANGAVALWFNTSGTYNTANGGQALASNTNGSYNTANGFSALYSNTSGSDNTAAGYWALVNNTSGNNNIALGYAAGYSISTGSYNIDIGNAGVTGDNYTIRIGSGQSQTFIAGVINGNGGGLTNLIVSAAQLTSIGNTNGGLNNFFIGPSGSSTASGDNNTAAGVNALSANTSGSANTAYGLNALYSNTSGVANTASGVNALSANTSGSANTANGTSALAQNTSGNANTANGVGALHLNTIGSTNTVIGYRALYSNTNGSFNTAIGNDTLYFATSGSYNIALGYEAGYNFTGNESNNIDIGNMGVAGDNNTIRIGSGQSQTFIAGLINGNGGGLTNLNVSAAQLTSIGNTNGGSGNFFVGLAGNSTMSGSDNTANGVGALSSNTSGYDNTANGSGALYSNTNGCCNTANGFGALSSNTSGNNNTANGFESLTANTSGSANTANGDLALWFNTSGGNNTANGSGALSLNTNGCYNTASGGGALYSNTSGSNNIALGYLAGLFITTGSYNIDIGNEGYSTDANIIRIGTTQTATYLAGTVYANGVALSSDRDAKENFTAVNAREVLAKVVSLPVTEWNYKTDSKAVLHIGPMAQDFQAAFGLDGTDDKHISVVDEGGVALAAIQGLNQKLDEKDAEIQNLEKKLDELQAVVKQLAAQK